MMNEENAAGADFSGISHITPEFIKSLETKLIVQKSLLEDSIKEYETENRKMSNDNRARCSKLKLMKKDVSCGKKRIEELKKNLEGLKQSSKELSEHNLMLKIYIEIYENESIDIAEAQEKSLRKSDDIWKIYKEKYEKIPLAMELRRNEIDFEARRIELMIKRYKFSEKKTMISKRITIHERQRNLLILESAKFWKSAECEENKIFEALDAKRKIRIELQKQETMIKTLMEEKRNERIKAQEKFSAEKIGGRILTKNFITPRFKRLAIPRLGMPQPVILNCWKNDTDNVSICSTLIDELLVESSAPDSALENEKSNHRSDTTMNQDRSVEALITKTGTDKMNELENNSGSKKLQVFARDDKIPVYDDGDGVRSDVEERKGEFPDEIERGEGGGGKENNIRESQGSDNNPEKESRIVYNEVPEKRSIDEKNETKYPTIRSIENVEFNLPFKKIPAAYSEKFIDRREPMSGLNNQGDFMGSEINWKRGNRTDSLYTLADSRKDAEFDSILGSQTSMQSEEMMKRFRRALGSPEFCDNDHDSVSVTENDRPAIGSSQLIAGGFSTHRESTTDPSPFIDIGTIGSATPSNRNRGEDRFFLNMF